MIPKFKILKTLWKHFWSRSGQHVRTEHLELYVAHFCFKCSVLTYWRRRRRRQKPQKLHIGHGRLSHQWAEATDGRNMRAASARTMTSSSSHSGGGVMKSTILWSSAPECPWILWSLPVRRTCTPHPPLCSDLPRCLTSITWTSLAVLKSQMLPAAQVKNSSVSLSECSYHFIKIVQFVTKVIICVRWQEVQFTLCDVDICLYAGSSPVCISVHQMSSHQHFLCRLMMSHGAPPYSVVCRHPLLNQF